MKFTARAQYVRFAPDKIRPLVNNLRKKSVINALNWLATYSVKRAVPITKVIQSAVGNAKSQSNVGLESLFIEEIRVDRGPMIRYFKPGAMGRSNGYTKRLCHISVIVSSFETEGS